LAKPHLSSYIIYKIISLKRIQKRKLQWTVTRDSNHLSNHFISQKWFFHLVLLYFIIKSISKNHEFSPCIPSSKIWLFRRKLITLWKIELECYIMSQIIGIFLVYLFKTLTLKFYYKSIFRINKNWISCFCFFCKIFGNKRL
jgi:hypothetical protein